jgi:hypothetical protein
MFAQQRAKIERRAAAHLDAARDRHAHRVMPGRRMASGRGQSAAQADGGLLACGATGEFAAQAAAFKRDIEVLLQIQQQDHREHIMPRFVAPAALAEERHWTGIIRNRSSCPSCRRPAISMA